jgi:hypothetical protein
VFFKIIPALLLCTVKFIAGVPALYLLTNWDFLPLFTVSWLAGSTGVFAFLFLEEGLVKIWTLIRKAVFPSRDTQPKPRKKVFSRQSRTLVKIIRRYGLPGIAFITPTIISIPVGTLLAGRLFENNKVIFLYLSASVMLWSAILSALLTLGYI